jgi:hypothetical protein
MIKIKILIDSAVKLNQDKSNIRNFLINVKISFKMILLRLQVNYVH